MRIAYTLATGRGQTDRLLSLAAAAAANLGMRCAGAVQYNSMPNDRRICDMDVKVLPDGPLIRISENRGPEAKGCRLDPNALETAVALTEQALETAPDLLVINKFGKHEASGRGFRPLIAEALAQDIPVLVGVNALNEGAFVEFTAGSARQLEPDLEEILTWIKSTSAGNRDAA